MVTFAGMALKLEKVGPTFSGFDPCPSYPGYKRFFSRVRLDALVSFAGRQLTESGNRA